MEEEDYDNLNLEVMKVIKESLVRDSDYKTFQAMFLIKQQEEEIIGDIKDFIQEQIENIWMNEDQLKGKTNE